MRKYGHLRLVYSKQQTPFEKFFEWLNKPRQISFTLPSWLRFGKTDEEKAEYLRCALSAAYGDFDYTTQSVNLFPSIRAADAVEQMIVDGTLDYYYKRHVRYTKFMKSLA